jgi:hypothetical protein
MTIKKITPSFLLFFELRLELQQSNLPAAARTIKLRFPSPTYLATILKAFL